MKKENLKNKLIRAYCMLIAEKGYAAVTVKNIYERAEVSKMTFYRHFGSINALEEEVKNNLLSALNGFINVLKEAQHVTDLNETFFYIEKKLIDIYPLYSPLANIKNKPPFLEEVENLTQTVVKQAFSDVSALSIEEVDFLHAFLMGGGTACVKEYADNQHTASPEHIVAMLFRLIFYGLSGLFARKEKN